MQFPGLGAALPVFAQEHTVDYTMSISWLNTTVIEPLAETAR